MNKYDQRAWKWSCPWQYCSPENFYVCEPEDAAVAVEHGVVDRCTICGHKVELRLQGTNGGTADIKGRVVA